MRKAAGALLIGSLALAQQGASPAACRTCHAQEASTQPASRHASALRPILDTELPQLLKDAPIQERSGLRYTYAPAPGGLAVTVEKDRQRKTALLEWAFGSGAQAITPVGIRNGIYFEHRVSFYTAAGQPGRTLGHSGNPVATLEEAFGIPQPKETIQRCFGCHANRTNANEIVPGVTCERCHGSAAAHVSSQAPMKKLTSMSAQDKVAFCSECHRSPEAERTSLSDPMAVRFQPIGLIASKCFQKSGSLSCVTCHNPHRDASRDPQTYVRQCLECHSRQTVASTRCGIASGQDCVPCHMPKQSPAPMLSFTNHHIAIY